MVFDAWRLPRAIRRRWIRLIYGPTSGPPWDGSTIWDGDGHVYGWPGAAPQPPSGEPPDSTSPPPLAG